MYNWFMKLIILDFYIIIPVTSNIVQFANNTGDFTLIAFFPIHESGLHGEQLCGEIAPEDGMQMLEAFLFTLDDLNVGDNNLTLLIGNKTMGGLAFDSCNSDSYALEQAMGVIRILMARSDNDDTIPYYCPNSNYSRPELRPETADWQRMVGVIGSSSSGVTIALANTFRAFNIPQISHQSTSSEISNIIRFPYLARTVPSDNKQSHAVMTLLTEMNWRYVSIVYETSNYGTRGFNELTSIAITYGICFEEVLRIKVGEPGLLQYVKVMRKLTDENRKARTVIVYLDYTNADYLFEAAAQIGYNNTLHFVGLDGWSGRMSVVEKHKWVVDNSLTVQPYAYLLKGFDEYFTKLKPSTNKRNPWFRAYWEMHFNCTFQNQSHKRKCNESDTISSENGYSQFPSLNFVYDAVLVFYDSLQRLFADKCEDVFDCPAMRPGNMSGTDLMEYIRNTSMTSVTGLPFEFDNKIDGPPRYSVLRYSKSKNWQLVGIYSEVEGETNNETYLNFTREFDENYRHLYNRSICSNECSFGQIRRFISGSEKICCWTCIDCSKWAIIKKAGLLEICSECRNGTKPNVELSQCLNIPEEFISYKDTIGLVCLIISALGLVWLMITSIIIFKYRSTPVVKASSIELSAVLLCGCFLCFISSVIFLAKPSKATCGLNRFLIGFCYASIYAPILTKTNRVFRIFHSEKSGRKRTIRLISPKSQLIIVACLIGIEVLIVGSWLVTLQPDVINIYPSREINILICRGMESVTFLIPLIYPIILIIFCTYYAIRTRKAPDGFNESRLIGFTTYSTWVFWIGFLLLFFTSYTIRPIAMSLALSVNAIVILGCVFAPKIYLCIFRPHKNTKEAVMTRRGSVLQPGSFSVSESIPNNNNNNIYNNNNTNNINSKNTNGSITLKELRLSPIPPKRRRCKTMMV